MSAVAVSEAVPLSAPDAAVAPAASPPPAAGDKKAKKEKEKEKEKDPNRSKHRREQRKKSKAKGSISGAPGSDEKKGDDKETEPPVDDNPYIEVINKRSRALGKKVQKISQLEAEAEASKKVLNKEQQELVASKVGLQLTLKEMQALVTRYREVAIEERKKSAGVASAIHELQALSQALRYGSRHAELLAELGSQKITAADLEAVQAAAVAISSPAAQHLYPAEQAAQAARLTMKYVEGANDLVPGSHSTFAHVRSVAAAIANTRFFTGKAPAAVASAPAPVVPPVVEEVKVAPVDEAADAALAQELAEDAQGPSESPEPADEAEQPFSELPRKKDRSERRGRVGRGGRGGGRGQRPPREPRADSGAHARNGQNGDAPRESRGGRGRDRGRGGREGRGRGGRDGRGRGGSRPSSGAPMGAPAPSGSA